MASNDTVAIMGFLGGLAIGTGVAGKAASSVGGMIKIGDWGTAFVDGLGDIYNTIKDSAGNIKITTPKLDGLGNALKLAVEKTAGGISKGIGKVVTFSGGVLKAIKDGYGNGVNAESLNAPGSVDSDGTFQFKGVSNEDIQRVNDIFSSYAQSMPSDLIPGEEIIPSDYGAEGSFAPTSNTTEIAKPKATSAIDNKTLLIIGGGLAALVVVAMFLTRQRGR